MKYLLALLISCNAFAVDFNDPRVIVVYGKESAGTAFSVIAPSGKVYLVTNAHVCDKDKEMAYREGDTPEIAVIIKINVSTDLCIMASNKKEGFKIAQDYKRNESIQILGYPELVRSLFKGVLSGFIHNAEGFFLESPLACKGGSSGSPMLNSKDEVIGVVAMASMDPKRPDALAIPVIYLKEILKDL